MTTEDLLVLLPDLSSSDSTCIIEGHRLPADGVQYLLSNPQHAVWLAPSRSVVEGRIGPWGRMAEGFTDPEAGMRRITERFHGVSEYLVSAAEDLGLGVIRINNGDEPNEIAARVARHYGFSPP
ncbi:MAG: hypothetical protein HN368_05565 [Spirochaetales bacterium]|jgi:hypothetical protein|nr:hypothetical protein [Spirochaetales bacterium]